MLKDKFWENLLKFLLAFSEILGTLKQNSVLQMQYFHGSSPMGMCLKGMPLTQNSKIINTHWGQDALNFLLIRYNYQNCQQ